MGSSRLFDLSRVLDVPVGYFFDEMPDDVAKRSPAKRQGGWSDREQAKFEHKRDPMVKRETLELVRAYYKIENEALRKRVFELTKSVAAAAEKGARARQKAKKALRSPGTA